MVVWKGRTKEHNLYIDLWSGIDEEENVKCSARDDDDDDDDGNDDEEEEGKERDFNKKVFFKISSSVKTAVLTDFHYLLGIVLC